ncbi:hypothetical protein DRW07_00220 [Alteromonas sediminis]|uniref:Uncharacterized protein n=1 Tax=Alteromonas sediminis TaxID=2259342 RepID=A0A3N5Y473_9ALTE|nr:hypothetical protein [Alteromonas sediminis]RPJ67873.1 hypothetical protein DRW07_00220 [Alteromonas sediminis]
MAALSLLPLQAISDNYAGSPDVANCPENFHSIALHQDAKLCQIFDEGLPATLVYHLKLSPNQVVTYYTQADGFEVRSVVGERTLISNNQDSKRIVISPDGKGTQIDILVISTN